MYTPPYLQKYKGISTRHTCPECGQKQSFTLYLDGNTDEPIHQTVGKCNRETKCGYHYTPKQFFADNPLSKNNISKLHLRTYHTNREIVSTPISKGRGVGGEVSFSIVERSASYKSDFVNFLCGFLSINQIKTIGDKYALGSTKVGDVIFWQIDSKGKVRTGKIMQYNPETGKRIKHESGSIDWVHNKLKKIGKLPDDFNLQQCFFGEHLLTMYPEATVCIVESEKSALIASAIFPEQVWLAAGGIQGLSEDKCKVLLNRNVILYPDLNAYDKWHEKAQMLNSLSSSRSGESLGVRCSSLLEDIATPEAKAKGLDVADYMINQLAKNKADSFEPSIPNTQSRFSPFLESMIQRNPILLEFIDNFDLLECR